VIRDLVTEGARDEPRHDLFTRYEGANFQRT